MLGDDPSLEYIIWSYDSLFFLSSGVFNSSSVECLDDDLYTHLLFSIRIFAHNAGPISVLGPSLLPKTHLSSGYVTALSLKYTQSHQPNSHKCLMLAVSPFITALGTSPLSSKTLFVVHDLISISNSKQSSHNFFGELDLILFLPRPFFSSLMALSAAFCHGEYDSVCFTWQSAYLASCLNSPITCSLSLSITRVLGTPCYANRSDNVSCASLFFAIEYALHHVYLWA